MIRNINWKSVKDVQHIIDKATSLMERKQFDDAARHLVSITFHYLLVWGEYDLILSLWNRCIDKVTTSYLKIEACNNIGLAYKYKGLLDEALAYFEKGLAIAKETENTEWIGVFNNNLGIVYSEKEDYGRAIERYNMLLKISRHINKKIDEGIALGNIGNAYFWLGKYEPSIDYCEQHIKIAREIGDKRGEGNSLGTIGSCYQQLKKYKKAITYQEKYLSIALEINDLEGKANSYRGLAEARDLLGENDKAEEFYLKSYAEWKKSGNLSEIREILTEIIEFYTKTGDVKKAGQYKNEQSGL